jgi:Domain of unknown function (DUF4365)
MDKKIDTSGHRGDAGVALVHLRTSQMGYVWHDRAVDAGIDGTIEVRNPTSGLMTNRHLLVQSKASGKPFPGENDRTFHYQCDARDVDYWMRAEVPVILVCSHPDQELAWWAHVQGWFSDPVRRASGRIDFDKATQAFDGAAANRLLSLADPHADAHTVLADERPETLLSNLQPVTVPDVFFSCPTTAKGPGDVYRAMRTVPGRPIRLDWALHAGRLLTVLDPAETSLGAAVTGPPEPVGADELEGAAPDGRVLVRLLNQALMQDVSADCTYHRGRNILFFSASKDLKPKKITGGTGQPRLVFHPKTNKATGKVGYYKHAALGWRFMHLEGRWVCALSPDAHYTRDGRQDSRFIAEYLSGLKRLDRNPAVLGHLRMWAAYLQGEETLLDPEPDRLLGFGPLLQFDSAYGIDDADWSADHRAGRQSTTTPDRDLPSLFDEFHEFGEAS